MDESLAVKIASVPVTTVTGTWLRHAFAAYPERALDGRVYDGRWGTKPGFPVLYLGRPLDSVVVEAYRHLVDPVENPDLLAQIHPRILVTATVKVTNVLDLRTAGARATAGLTPATCAPEPTTTPDAKKSRRSRTNCACTASSPRQRPTWAKLSPCSRTSPTPQGRRPRASPTMSFGKRSHQTRE